MAALLLPATFLAAHGRSLAAERPRPNVVFIMADDLGWADVGFHGGRAPTPRLDRLAREGMELTAHHVAPVCSPTRAGLLTGRLWSRFGVTTPVNRRALPWDTLTLPRALQAAGYDTCLTGKWHLGSLPEEGPNHFGFDHSYGSLAGGVTPWLHFYKQGPWMRTWHRDGTMIEEPGHATDLITTEAVRWIESRGERPFFLYVPFTAVHLPIKEPEEWLARVPAEITGDVPRHYAACIMHLDDAVGRILDSLERTGRRNDTLVVFTSDNGGSTFENDDRSYPDDGCPQGRLTGDNRPLRGEKGSVYEGGTRVPTIVAWPGVISPGKVDTPTQVIDWMPTLCGLAGHAPAADAKWDGVDLTPLLLERRPLPDRSLYTPGAQWRSQALRTGDWKLVVHGSDPDRRTELYDLATDPQEAHDLAAREPQRVERMLADLARLAASDNDARVAPPRAAGGRRPNIIVMLIDDLGYGDLGCFGCRDIPTPHIDALAAGGMRCTNAYVTNPPCSPSRASLITGMYAQRFGKSGMARGLPIPADHPTLAELLRDAGYVTGMIGKWDLGSWNQGPLDRGFMEVARSPTSPKPFICLRPDGSEVFRTELEAERMVEFVERHHDRPFFLYFAPYVVHSPSKDTPAHYQNRTTAAGERRPLAGAIVAVDDAVGKLRATLRRLRLEQDTFIFLTGDNGPNLVEGGSAAPYRGGNGRGSQFEGWVREPTIVSWPGRIPAGRTYDGLMGTIDAYATAAALAGRPVPPRCDGVDLLPILERKQPQDAHEALFWLNADPEDEPHRKLRAMRWRQWRLVEYPEGWRLFDLTADPQETRDRAGDHPEVVADMRQRYDAWAGQFPPPDTSWTQDRRGGRMPQGWGWEIAP